MKIVATVEAYREDESFEDEHFIIASGNGIDDIEITVPDGRTFIVSFDDISAALHACRLACGK